LSAINEYPEKFQEFQNAVVRNDFNTANSLAKELGLTEDQLVERGGGKVGLYTAVITGVALYAAIIMATESIAK
jgi:hypothetical protein